MRRMHVAAFCRRWAAEFAYSAGGLSLSILAILCWRLSSAHHSVACQGNFMQCTADFCKGGPRSEERRHRLCFAEPRQSTSLNLVSFQQSLFQRRVIGFRGPIANALLPHTEEGGVAGWEPLALRCAPIRGISLGRTALPPGSRSLTLTGQRSAALR